MRNHDRTLTHLSNMGLGPLASQIIDGLLTDSTVLPLSSLKTAKLVQKLFYDLLWFYPEAKSQVKLRLDPETATLSLIPTSKTEKRGRRRIQ